MWQGTASPAIIPDRRDPEDAAVTEYTEMHLDALAELSNIGSGSAATALADLLGRPVDISVPAASATPFSEATAKIGDPSSPIVAVTVATAGDLQALVLILMTPEQSDELIGMFGSEPGSDLAESTLQEVGNILASKYAGALTEMAGLEYDQSTPMLVRDMLGAIVESALAYGVGTSDLALMIDTSLEIEGSACNLDVLLVPRQDSIERVFQTLGIA